jgi:hypothetical protein
MKSYALFIVFLMLSAKSYSLGDTSILPDDPEAMTDTVGRLKENESSSRMEQQDRQNIEDQREREKEKREKKKQKELLEGRFDVP